MTADRSAAYLFSGALLTVIGVLVVHSHPWAWWAVIILTLGIADLLTGVVALGVREALNLNTSKTDEDTATVERIPTSRTSRAAEAVRQAAPYPRATGSLPPRRIDSTDEA